MTPDEQLAEWCKGNSIHNESTGECCPDFSCCDPNLGIPIQQRILFRDSGEDVRFEMLMMFLGTMLSSLGVKVYLAGEAGETEH